MIEPKKKLAQKKPTFLFHRRLPGHLAQRSSERFTVSKYFLKPKVPWALKEQQLGSNAVPPSFPLRGY
jgi:hypothetical protein